MRRLDMRLTFIQLILLTRPMDIRLTVIHQDITRLLSVLALHLHSDTVGGDAAVEDGVTVVESEEGMAVAGVVEAVGVMAEAGEEGMAEDAGGVVVVNTLNLRRVRSEK